MPKIEAKVPQAMLTKLDMLATVDELTRGEVVRIAIREYFEGIDWRATEKEYGELTEEGEDDDADE